MTAKPQKPVETTVDIVEMDAMDLNEWEGEQLTPQASDARLAALIKQSAPPIPEPALAAARPSTITRSATPAPATRSAISIPSVATPRAMPTVAARPDPTPVPRARVIPVAVPVVPIVPVVPVVPVPVPVRPPVVLPLTPAAAKPIVAARREPTPLPRTLVLPLPPIVEPVAIVASIAAVAPPVAPVAMVETVVPPLPLAGENVADPTGPGPHSVAVTTPDSPLDRLAESRPVRSRRPLVIALSAFAVVAIVIAIVAAAGHGDREVARPALVERVPPPEPAVATPEAVAAVVAPAPSKPPIETPTATAPTAPPAPIKPGMRVVARARPTKKLVLDYDKTPAKPTEAGSKADDQALTKARAQYAAGNQRLFAGDPNGAIHAYQQALATYPGYVAGYRGLGLAYAQLGDKSNAVAAFRTYVRLVPAAKDVALVKKRIAGLSGT